MRGTSSDPSKAMVPKNTVSTGESHPSAESQEELLAEINRTLYPLEMSQVARFIEPKLPVVFVFGAPRSGHTLFSQLLVASRGFAAISNFVARFWMAPYIGAKLQSALGIDSDAAGSFTSTYGKTQGWSDTHEFGNFVLRWLPFDDTHVVSRRVVAAEKRREIRREIAALEDFYGRPLLLRNLVYGLNLELVREVFPEAMFVYCRRKALYQAQSIFLARERLLGSAADWWSLRPREYAMLCRGSVWEQIAGQIHFTHRAIRDGLADVPSIQQVEIQYEETVLDPCGQVQRVVDRFSQLGHPVASHLDNLPERLNSTDELRLPERNANLMRKALSRYFEPQEIE